MKLPPCLFSFPSLDICNAPVRGAGEVLCRADDAVKTWLLSPEEGAISPPSLAPFSPVAGHDLLTCLTQFPFRSKGCSLLQPPSFHFFLVTLTKLPIYCFWGKQEAKDLEANTAGWCYALEGVCSSEQWLWRLQ